MRAIICIFLIFVCCIFTASALDDYDYYQSISYSACDQEIYQQDIVIHRSTGTAYNETAGGLETWHIYVGDHCQADYGDVRFANSTGELAYYLWPDFDSSSARFAVRLEGATSAGQMQVWYGNAAATTTSDKSATYVDAISNPSFETTGSWTWTKDSTKGNSLTLPSTGWYSEGAASVYFDVGWGGAYPGAHYSQISQTVSLPAGDYLLEFDVKGSSITSGYGYMEVWIDGIQKYRKTSAGEGYHQLTSPFTSDGSVSVTLKNGIAAGGVIRYASGYWDALALRYYSPSPPTASDFSGEICARYVRSYPGYNRPTDPDADGLYEDVNGNGRLDFQDIMIFFQYNAWAKANQPKVECWDWSGNGAIEFSDVQAFWEAEFT